MGARGLFGWMHQIVRVRKRKEKKLAAKIDWIHQTSKGRKLARPVGKKCTKKECPKNTSNKQGRRKLATHVEKKSAKRVEYIKQAEKGKLHGPRAKVLPGSLEACNLLWPRSQISHPDLNVGLQSFAQGVVSFALFNYYISLGNRSSSRIFPITFYLAQHSSPPPCSQTVVLVVGRNLEGCSVQSWRFTFWVIFLFKSKCLYTMVVAFLSFHWHQALRLSCWEGTWMTPSVVSPV